MVSSSVWVGGSSDFGSNSDAQPLKIMAEKIMTMIAENGIFLTEFIMSNSPCLFTGFIDVAVNTMIIDHADSLHKCIKNDRANKFKSAFFQIF